MTRANAGGGDGADALARMRDLSDSARIPDRRDGERGSASTAALRLWEALCQARNEQQPLTQARFEDAVFGFYLPRARALADRIGAEETDPDARGRAAELGLARAVLGWQPEDPEGFERFLRASVASELRNTERRRRPTRGSGSARPRVGEGGSVGLAGSGESTPEYWIRRIHARVEIASKP